MKKIYIYAAALVVIAGTLSACKKFLEINPQERVLVTDYYKTPSDAFAAMVSVYQQFGAQSSGYITKVGLMDAASDDHFAGGGGPNDIGQLQVMSNYTLNKDFGPSWLWDRSYSGIYRANTFLQKVPEIEMDANLKARYIAEVKAMRAWFYFDLVRFFKNVPLFLTPVEPDKMYDAVQAPPADVYTQVEKDLTEAIAVLPPTVPAASEGGRFTKGAAQALLGKVYIWQKKWGPAAGLFAEVNGTPGGTSQYGYKLLTNYADLWKTSNKFNTESILEIVHTTASSASWGDVATTRGNVLNVLTGPRGYSKKTSAAPDYISGWSFLVFTPEFYTFMGNDPRKSSTIADIKAMKAAGIVDYQPGYMDTGYFLEKFAGRESNKAPTGTAELNFPQNMYEIRLADTYLLEAEAIVQNGGASGAGSRAYQLLNAIRSRVGLSPVDASLANIKIERRLELAGEGHRWPDLVRWGDAPAALAFKGFVAGKHEIFPIPQGALDNTKLEQNKEWGGTK